MLTEEAAQELTSVVGLEWGDEDRRLLAPLVDAALVWAWPEQMAPITVPIVEALWADGVREDVERALDDAAPERDLARRRFAEASADLTLGPRRSRLARAVVEQAAFPLAGADLLPMHCLLCLEERLARARARDRGSLVLQVARLARRVLDVPPAEVQAAIVTAAAGRADPAITLGTGRRRRLVREWLARLAELGADSIPTVSRELAAAVRAPPGEAGADVLWRTAVDGLTEGLAAESS